MLSYKYLLYNFMSFISTSLNLWYFNYLWVLFYYLFCGFFSKGFLFSFLVYPKLFFSKFLPNAALTWGFTTTHSIIIYIISLQLFFFFKFNLYIKAYTQLSILALLLGMIWGCVNGPWGFLWNYDSIEYALLFFVSHFLFLFHRKLHTIVLEFFVYLYFCGVAYLLFLRLGIVPSRHQFLLLSSSKILFKFFFVIVFLLSITISIFFFRYTNSTFNKLAFFGMNQLYAYTSYVIFNYKKSISFGGMPSLTTIVSFFGFILVFKIKVFYFFVYFFFCALLLNFIYLKLLAKGLYWVHLLFCFIVVKQLNTLHIVYYTNKFTLPYMNAYLNNINNFFQIKFFQFQGKSFLNFYTKSVISTVNNYHSLFYIKCNALVSTAYFFFFL